MIITVINQKGGSGKTTTIVNLGAYLAALGKSVLLIDCDPQADATKFLGFEPEAEKKSLYDVFFDRFFVEDIVKKTGQFGYEIVPANYNLFQAQEKLVRVARKEKRLKEALSAIGHDYDFILIDCPPSLGPLTLNSLVAAQKVLIPIQCEYFALESLGQLLKVIDFVQKRFNRKIKIMGAVLTMHEKWNKLSAHVAKEVIRHFPGYVFEAIIPRSVKLAEAPVHKKTILYYASSSAGAKAYRQLAQEVIKRSRRS